MESHPNFDRAQAALDAARAGDYGPAFDAFADDVINLIHETGEAHGGDKFDNLAVYVSRVRPDGKTDRLWTVDLDAEHCEEFWEKNPGQPSKDFS